MVSLLQGVTSPEQEPLRGAYWDADLASQIPERSREAPQEAAEGIVEWRVTQRSDEVDGAGEAVSDLVEHGETHERAQPRSRQTALLISPLHLRGELPRERKQWVERHSGYEAGVSSPVEIAQVWESSEAQRGPALILAFEATHRAGDSSAGSQWERVPLSTRSR